MEPVCCQGWSFGASANASLGIPAGTFAGMFGRHPKSIRFAEVTDGLSNTFMIGEYKVGTCCLEGWAHTDSAVATCAIPPNTRQPNGQPYPSSSWQDTYAFGSYHPSGVQFAMTDGSVRFIPSSIDLQQYRALATRRSGDIAPLP